MAYEYYLFPIDITGDFEPDSIENCEILFHIIGNAAISVSQEYPDKEILVVYEIDYES